MKDRDRQLVERFQRGDKTAFDKLMRIYHGKIYRLAYRFTHDVEDALDLSQEIFLKAFKSLGDFKHQSSFYTWLYRIARNLCVDYLRHKKTSFQTIPLEEVSDVLTYSSPCDPVEVKELRGEIAKAISALPPQQKQAFILRYYEGLDLESIARVLGCRESTVRSHLCLGRRKIREILSPYLGGR